MNKIAQPHQPRNNPAYLRTLSHQHRVRLRLLRAETNVDRPWSRLRSLNVDAALTAWESFQASGGVR